MRRNLQESDPVREAALNALAHLVDPLLDLMFDLGVSVYDVNALVRARAVQVANKRLVRDECVSSKSRIAIITGLPRSEVTKLSKLPDSLPGTKLGQLPAQRTLQAWLNDPSYLTPSGEPAVLPIFGKRRSFEQLVSRYCAGIPLRALLDELIQIGAVDRLPNQRLRTSTCASTSTNFAPNAIEAVGEKCRELLVTLIQNLRGEQRMIESTTLVANGDPKTLRDFRKGVVADGKYFINEVAYLLKRLQNKNKQVRNREPRRVGVTIYYFEDPCPPNKASTQFNKKPVRRKNLRRR